MDRVIIPLKKMGADFESDNGKLPIKIFPPQEIKHINFEVPVASAQIKSSLIFAGLHSEGISSIVEKIPSRNHTEIMLGLEVKQSETGNTVLFSKKNYPVPSTYFIPSDVSSASFFIVLAILSKNSFIRIRNVSLNKTRTGYLDILKKMGAKIDFENISISSGEPFGDIIAESSDLENVEIPGTLIPNLIDEIPILAVAGLFAEGNFTIRGADELRKKESDRIKSISLNFKQSGIEVDEYEDGFTISGKIKNKKIVFDSFNDHRIAMSFSILSLLLNDGGKVNNFNCVKISNPGFLNQLKQITG
jgi:3-phosphoshikimate 1-carboxyvinyltransferase